MQENTFGVSIPFVELLGFRLGLLEAGRSRVDFEPRPEHCNSYAVTHGGAVMTLLDVGMATAARSLQPEMGIVTIEMKASFMRPSLGPLTCHGRVMHRTATLAFMEATVYDAEDQACAHATGTFKYMQRLAAGARGLNPQGAIATD
jgi:uncharacterized protein (TIGR00369 family)